MKEKIKLTFSRLFIILLQYILFLKEFFACNGCFGLFTKIEMGSGASFWCTFSAWLFHKNVPCLILYQWTRVQCHTFFPSQDIKQSCYVLLYTIDDVINFKMYLRSNSKATGDKEKKRGRRKYKNLNILWTKRAF